MTRLLKMLCIGLLAAFFAGTVAQAASMGMMAVEMSDNDHSDMADISCAGCDDVSEDSHSACGGTCASAQVASLPVESDGPDAALDAVLVFPEAAFRSWTEPPARTPPRLFS